MNTHPSFRTASRTFLFLICAALLAVLPASARAGNAGKGVHEAELKLLEPPRAGSPVTARFDLKGYALPVGSYPSVNVEFPVRPEGMEPWVRPGCPDTVLTFHAPGRYRMRVILNQISKPSCGGVNAKLLLEQTLDVDVAP